ncbi:WUSCHEL-related homeobox 9-like [Bidens hawaiensis]|uniref:WUSCHEL-related homeobox 9-like n=1 Tax=Bidens hawaiensis TaxID=980011 RepID=UPI00404B7C44
MASSNRHWPNMFKSKSTYTTHQDHQWQSSHLSNRSSPYSSGCEERTPEPKPRWNPKPEQIRILESIFNSGLVNPPRDEIRRIRARLQEFGQVGDANVFYWFQNRKSRSKQKNRHLQKSQNHQPPGDCAADGKTITTSSSSSSDKSTKSIEFFLNSPSSVSVNQPAQTYLGTGGTSSNSSHQHHGEFFQEPFFFPAVQHKPPPAPTATSFTQGLCFPELLTMVDQDNQHKINDQTVVTSSGVLLTDLMMNHQYGIPHQSSSNKEVEEDNIIKMFSRSTPPPPPPPPPPALVAPPTTTIVESTTNFQGHVLEEVETGKLPIVFINDVAFEVAVGPFNVKEAFGGDAVLIDSSGQAVLTNEWGVTLQSLEHGSFYYLVRSFTYDHAGTGDLVHFHPFDIVNFVKVLLSYDQFQDE